MANVTVTATLEEVFEAFGSCQVAEGADLPGDLAYDMGTLRRRLRRPVVTFENDVKKPRLHAIAERNAKGQVIYADGQPKVDPTELAALEEELSEIARNKTVTLSVPEISITKFPGISGTPAKKGQTAKPAMFSGLGPFLKEYREEAERAKKEAAGVPEDDGEEDDDGDED